MTIVYNVRPVKQLLLQEHLSDLHQPLDHGTIVQSTI